ncbi:MAG: hypothetical protein AAF357_19605, partial [Verrucomicrobiota bacterium]
IPIVGWRQTWVKTGDVAACSGTGQVSFWRCPILEAALDDQFLCREKSAACQAKPPNPKG